MMQTGKYELTNLGLLKGQEIYLLNLDGEDAVFYAIRIKGKLHFLFERKGDLIDDLQQLIEKEKLYGKSSKNSK